MTRNQMIGVGCGGAGCLGLIVVALAGFGVYWYNRTPARHESNVNINVDRSSNRNSNTSTSETNSNSTNSNSTSSEATTATDGQHRLYQAAAATYDKDLIKRVNRKLGLVDAEGVPTKQYSEFLKEHLKWIFSNTDWIQTINTQEKARAYAEAHIDD